MKLQVDSRLILNEILVDQIQKSLSYKVTLAGLRVGLRSPYPSLKYSTNLPLSVRKFSSESAFVINEVL